MIDMRRPILLTGPRARLFTTEVGHAHARAFVETVQRFSSHWFFGSPSLSSQSVFFPLTHTYMPEVEQNVTQGIKIIMN